MGIDTSKICYGCFGEHDGNGPCPKCGFDIASAKHPAIALPIGTILNGRYLTGRVLGVGGFGVTYLALDMTLETSVAVKEYLPSGIAIRDDDHYTMTVSSQEEQEKFDTGADKFLDEARILAKLRTVPNIVTVHDYFRENGTAYFVMEYIEGVDLLKYATSKGGKLSFEETLDLMLPIIKSLGLVHEHNLLHRDISPDNIIVTKNKTTHLLDFGAARLAIDQSKSKSIILKHGFAPEEQYRKHGNQGPWSDEYALAATMYLIITGVMPPDAIERMHEDTLQKPSELGISMPGYAEDALMKALSVAASGRFPDMPSFAEAITGKNKPAVSAVAATAAVGASVAPSASAAPAAPSATYASAPAAPVPPTPPTPPVAPAAPVAPRAQSSYAQAPDAPQARSPYASAPAANSIAPQYSPSSYSSTGTVPAAAKAVSPAPVVLTEKKKKSIWQKPLTYVIAGIILVAGIATPVTYFALKKSKKTEETITETTKKRTKKTDPTDESTDPTDTLTDVSTDPSYNPAAVKEFRLDDITYCVSADWKDMKVSSYQYFYPDKDGGQDMMVVYSQQSLTVSQLPYINFDDFMEGFDAEFLNNGDFTNAQIVSETRDTTTNLNTSDIVMTGEVSGQPRELSIHVILDTDTGMAYVFMLNLRADMNASDHQGCLDRYWAAINSIEKDPDAPAPTDTTPAPTDTTPDATTEDLGDRNRFQEGPYTYTFTKEWQYLRKGMYNYFFVDYSQASTNFMMIYSDVVMTGDQLRIYGYDRAFDEMNTAMVGEFGPNAKLVSCEKYLDGDYDAYEDIVITGDYDGGPIKLPIRIYLDKESGNCYIFAMYMSANIDAAQQDDIMGKYNDCIKSIERTD